MRSMEDNVAIAKIRKLLALAKDNPEEHERQTARRKADAMMREFNLTEQEVVKGRREAPHGSRQWFADILNDIYVDQEKATRELIRAHADLESVERGLSRTLEAVERGDTNLDDPETLRRLLLALCRAQVTTARSVGPCIETALCYLANSTCRQDVRAALVRLGVLSPFGPVVTVNPFAGGNTTASGWAWS